MNRQAYEYVSGTLVGLLRQGLQTDEMSERIRRSIWLIWSVVGQLENGDVCEELNLYGPDGPADWADGSMTKRVP